MVINTISNDSSDVSGSTDPSNKTFWCQAQINIAEFDHLWAIN